MNKEKYKRLLQMRKSEEMMFYFLVKMGEKEKVTPREIIKKMPINEKRAHYLLQKWSDKGLYDYGVSLDLGWIIK